MSAGAYQPDMFPPYVKGSETSKDAAVSVEKAAPAMRAKVFGYVKATLRGATCDEVERMLSMSHQTCSARIRELFMRGDIEDSNIKRQTRSGRLAVVWKAKA